MPVPIETTGSVKLGIFGLWVLAGTHMCGFVMGSTVLKNLYYYVPPDEWAATRR
ncbi:MAG: hypothetical protein ACRDTH_28560 [Pseudonocardiaceae bacterium]